jgi:hypothetical protein
LVEWEKFEREHLRPLNSFFRRPPGIFDRALHRRRIRSCNPPCPRRRRPSPCLPLSPSSIPHLSPSPRHSSHAGSATRRCRPLVRRRVRIGRLPAAAAHIPRGRLDFVAADGGQRQSSRRRGRQLHRARRHSGLDQSDPPRPAGRLVCARFCARIADCERDCAVCVGPRAVL